MSRIDITKLILVSAFAASALAGCTNGHLDAQASGGEFAGHDAPDEKAKNQSQEVRTDTQPALQAGLEAKARGNLDLAEAKFREAIAEKPSSLAWHQLAVLLEEQNRDSEALDAYEHALVSDKSSGSSLSSDPAVLLKFAEIQEREGLAVNAAETFKKVVNAANPSMGKAFPEIMPASNSVEDMKAAAYGRLGSNLLHKSGSSNAVMYLKKAVTLNPESGPLNFHLGAAFFFKKDLASAVPYFRKAEQVGGEEYVHLRRRVLGIPDDSLNKAAR